MLYFRFKLIIVFIILLSNIIFPQNQANIWKCGLNSGLNFNSIPPTPISGQTSNADNSSSISDASGALLFYTDGSTIWNKNNVVMPNGAGLISSATGGQCGLIVPVPSSNKYVVFSNTEFSSPGQLHYTIVDMSLNSGLGDVVAGQKNISLGTGWTEKLCAYYNSYCNYYWVLMHRWNYNQFVALKVNAGGVTTTSVISGIGSVHNCGTYSGAHDAMGQLTISKDGKKIVNALTCQDKFELFDFDVNTGVLSNFISIPGNGGNAWGTGFSADSKKLYVNSIFGSQIFQYDLSNYNAASIISSKFSLYNTGTGGYNFGYMELGPDNKMYIPRPSSSFFSVINSPNSLGSAAGFTYAGLNISPFTTTHGISRIAYNIGVGAGVSTNTFTGTSATTNIKCNGLSTGSATVFAIGTGTYNYLWTPGGYTTSIANNLNAGVYTISINDGACYTSTTSITIIEPPALISSINSFTACDNTTSILSPLITGGTPSYSIYWNTGASSVSIAVSPSVTSIYNYTITDSNNCSKTQSVQITVESTIASFNNTAPSCQSLISFTNTSINSSFSSWDFGDGQSSSSNSITVNNYASSGTYTVSLISTTPFGCTDTIRNTINVNASNMNLDFDYIIKEFNCIDSISFINKSTGATSYTWNLGNGIKSNQIAPNSVYYPGNYQITLIGSSANCLDTIIKDVSIQTGINFMDNTPNVFTPNRDGVNDVFDFKVMSNCENFTFEIFDRWGLSIFKMMDKKQSFWDGRTTSGLEVTDGTYFYIMNIDNGTKLKGTVILFR